MRYRIAKRRRQLKIEENSNFEEQKSQLHQIKVFKAPTSSTEL